MLTSPSRSLLASILAFSVTSLTFAQSSTRDVATMKSELDRNLGSALQRSGIPGLVVAAATRDGAVYEGAFGIAESAGPRPMSADALFNIASMTKAITSVALLQFVEQGKIALDDEAGKYLPELASVQVFESFDPATGDYKLRAPKSPITVRHLLTHTSGLGYPFTSAVLAKFKPRAGETYPVGPLLFDPGTDWVYGTNTDMVGRIVEKLSGQNLEAYFQEKILGPLKMSDTSYNVPAEKHARIVNTWRQDEKGALVENPRTPPRGTTRFNGGGGLYSTASDYVRFLRMLLNRGELDGARILKPETVALLEQNHMGSVSVPVNKSTAPNLSADFNFIDDRQDKWGLAGLLTTRQIEGKRAAGSVSWGGIFNTFFWYDSKRGVAGVIMMQFLPFADAKALSVYDTFERGVYRIVGD